MQLGTATLLDAIRAPDRAASVALVDASGPTGALTFGDLVGLIESRGRAFDFDHRSVVVLAGVNGVDWIVSYLALLDRGHVPLLAGAVDAAVVERWVSDWRPAAIVSASTEDSKVERLVSTSTPIHPDLALLMSTSGSTGSPKLIRLSHRNLVANARSIVAFQGLVPDDRGVTNLPLHYSFGLSVVHSHLFAGASVVVTDSSVVDPCFAAGLDDHSVTNVAGVPHTFDLLEQAGPERLRTPSLRFLAQAGGRLAPDKVERWATRARSWGADWFTMYGQTEATARIAYLPPELATGHPGAIGHAVPGGELRIDEVDDFDTAAGVGELVYRGDNVMLGYAEELADLARGAELDELRTGDLARRDGASGLFEIVGRRARRVKPFGVRIDLDDVERRLTDRGIDAVVVGDDDLIVAAASASEPEELSRIVARITGLPERYCVGVSAEAPRHVNGKLDEGGLLMIGRGAQASSKRQAPGVVEPGDGMVQRLTAEFATVLGRDAVSPAESFVSLGGDSLTYIECSIRIERIVGSLPDDWHLMPIGQLAGAGRPGRWARVDTTVLLRAVGILAVVSTHMRFWHVPGGAHLMLGVVGYNVARFLLTIDDSRARLRAGLRTVARVAVPVVVWTAVFLVAGQYTWHTLTLVNNYIGPRSHAGNHWHFWFIEVMVHLVVVTTVVTAIPAVRRLDQRWPYAVPLVIFAMAIALRLDWADMGDWYNLRFRTHAVAWFFVLGWLVRRSVTVPQKLLTTVVCLASAPGVFMNPQREFFIAGGLVLLVWWRELPVPRVLVQPLGVLAAASLWIFVSHFVIWPPMKDLFIVEVAYPLTVLASLGVWRVVTAVTDQIGPAVGTLRHGRLGSSPRPSVAAATPV